MASYPVADVLMLFGPYQVGSILIAHKITVLSN